MRQILRHVGTALVAGGLLVAGVGCHTMRFELVNEPAATVISEHKSYFLWGLAPTVDVDVLEKCDVGFALVNVFGLRQSAVSWYVMLPARPLPSVLPVLGGPTPELKYAWIDCGPTARSSRAQLIPPAVLKVISNVWTPWSEAVKV